MKRTFVFPTNFSPHTTVVHFNEIKLAEEDDIEDKKRWLKNIGAKEEGRHLKRSNPDKRLLESLLQHAMYKATFHSIA